MSNDLPVPVVPEKDMTFVDHLAELRQRLIVCLVAVMLSATLAFFYANPVVAALQKLVPKGTLFVQLSPGEVFLANCKLAIFVGIGVALPLLLFQLFRFLSPGLEAHEKRFIFPLFILGFFLFVAGVAVGYWGILPFMLEFLLGYGQEVAHNQLSIASYMNFCLGFLAASGLVFQLPIVLLFMAWMGLITSKKLALQWRWAIVASFILGAIVTPSADPFSQTVMSISLAGLYGFSILLIKAFGR